MFDEELEGDGLANLIGRLRAMAWGMNSLNR